MKLSVKSDYAARAVLGLARHYPTGEALRVEDLAAEQAIPPNYLTQILIELKAQNIVRSLRGKEGGYLLGRAPAEISLGDVLCAVHGKVFDTPALSDNDFLLNFGAPGNICRSRCKRPLPQLLSNNCSMKTRRRTKCITSEKARYVKKS